MPRLDAGAYSTGGVLVAALTREALPANAIMHIKKPDWPQFHFEWHPGRRRVYVIRELDDEGRPLETAVRKGELVAFDIDDDGMAQNVVNIWLRGYRTRDQERQRNPALKAEDY